MTPKSLAIAGVLLMVIITIGLIIRTIRTEQEFK